MEMFKNPEHVAKAKEEFDRVMNGRTYKCPIPMDVPVPQPQK